MRNINFTLVILLFTFSSFVYGQEMNSTFKEVKKELPEKSHQIGISIERNKDISLAYRKSKGKNIFFRANLNVQSTGSFIDTNLQNFTMLTTLSAGIEKHISIEEKFSAYYGTEIKYNALIYGYGIRRSLITLSGLSGIKFKANDKIACFAEAQFGLLFNPFLQNQNLLWTVRHVNNLNFGVLYTFGKVA